MRLSLKMLLSTVVIVCAVVAVSGYALVSSSFSADLRSQKALAQEGTESFCLTLGTLTAGRLADRGETVSAAVAEALAAGSSLQSENYCVRLPDATFSGGEPLADRLPEDSGASCCLTREGDRYYMQTRRLLQLDDTVVTVDCFHELTPCFTRLQGSLRLYRLTVLAAIGISALLLGGMTAILLRPLRKLSRSTRQISRGQYTSRASVRSKDELGAFAADFNRMADSLEHKIAELSDAAQRQKDFTASFAHELKTPLTSVIGYADTLRSRVLSPEQQFEAANYIFTESRRLEQMSLSLLDLFSLEGHGAALRPVSAQAVCAQVSGRCTPLLLQAGLSLRLRTADAQVLAEPELLKTLLYNLIDNARKASHTGQSILLLGEHTPEGYRFTVQDEGCGIPEAMLSRITEPFFMVDKSRARASGGAGLGLALGSRIAEAHGSRLTFRSEPGKGTSASFLCQEVTQ